jgi:hypothetical protein
MLKCQYETPTARPFWNLETQIVRGMNLCVSMTLMAYGPSPGQARLAWPGMPLWLRAGDLAL